MIKNNSKSFKINSYNKNNNYSVDCHQIDELIYNVKLGYNIIVMGSFKSSKTATLDSISLMINTEYSTLRFSFPHNLDGISISDFVYRSLNCDVGSDLNVYFKDRYGKVVLLFDDFHNVIGQKDIQSFLLLLKRLREDSNSSIQAIVVFGNYDLFKISSLLDRFVTLPPVSFESFIFLSNANKESTSSIFKEWSNDNGVLISDEVLNELWLLCNGNLHLINIIGIILTKLYKFEGCKSFNSTNININSIKKSIIELIKQQQQFNFLKSYIYKASLVDKINNISLNNSYIDYIPHNDLIVLSNYGLFYYKDSKFHVSAQILLDYLFDKSSSVL